jgi:hypothetical protein
VLKLEDELLARGIQASGSKLSLDQLKAALASSSDVVSTDIGSIDPTAQLSRLEQAFKTGLPEELRPIAQQLARLDARYANPRFVPGAPIPV